MEKKLFGDVKNIKNLNIPNSVISIGTWAFRELTNLTHMTIGSSVTQIVMGTFSECYALESITCNAIIPPNVDKNIFEDIIYTNTPLYVPEESLKRYQTTYPWSDFYMIADVAGINDVYTDSNNLDFSIFDLSGKCILKKGSSNDIKRLPSDIYIINGKNFF